MIYLIDRWQEVGKLLLEHLQITALSVGIAVAIALPLSLCLYLYRGVRVLVIGILGTIYTIPSLALIILLVPIFGLNARSVVVAMVAYTQVILVRNLLVGLDGIAPEIIEAAKGAGMNAWQTWWWVQFPLIVPVFLAGVRLATIVTIAIASIGAKFGAGGLGELLFQGIQQNRQDKIWAGTLVLAILALGLSTFLTVLERLARRHRPPSA